MTPSVVLHHASAGNRPAASASASHGGTAAAQESRRPTRSRCRRLKQIRNLVGQRNRQVAVHDKHLVALVAVGQMVFDVSP